jgi:hypothetical protein
MVQWLWTQKQDIGPAPRWAHDMAYDGARKVLVLFGGRTTAGRLNDTWEWDGEMWTQVADTGPTQRTYHAVTFDSVRQRVLLFGGYGNPTVTGPLYLNDTWEWDGEVWTQVADTGPSPRTAHAITFDSVRQRVVLFGGWGGGADVLNDTWEWDGAVWTQVADTGPSPRMECAMTFDTMRERVVLFGGDNTTSGEFFNDTWEWDGEDWTQVADTGPLPRGFPTMAQMGTRTGLFGGYDGGALLADTWEWKDLRWTQRQDMGPPNRAAHSMAYDSERQRTVLFGGIGSSDLSTVLGDTWELAINPPPAE